MLQNRGVFARMTLFPKKRAWIAGTALLLAVSLGSLAGYLLGRAEVLRSAEARLVQDAANMDEMLSSLVIESQDLIAAINASKFPLCSDEEIAWFRRLMYH
jgi:membrane protein YqaA with SNARE-associated domain